MKNISDSQILETIKKLAVEERRITLELLRYLKELDARRLYARKCSSLHEFCVKELGYSSGAAHRRIESMELLKDVPEAEEKVLSGELNLTILSQIQGYVEHEKKNKKIVSLEDKQKLVESSSGKSVREVQKDIITLAPTLAPKFREAIMPLPQNKTAVKLIADQELMELLEYARSLGGAPGESISDTFKRLLRFYISKKNTYGKTKQESRLPKGTMSGAGAKTHARVKQARSRYIPKPEMMRTRSRANHQCEHKDPDTEKRCGNKQALQIDHIIPFAKGGESIAENLQLLCPAHNRYKAIQDYGTQKMAFYLS